MIGHEIDVPDGDALVRLVRALGQHRYIASRLHLVHAFAIEAACASALDPALAEAQVWSRTVLADPEVDPASKDERLHRRATDAELVAVLTAFWGGDGDRARREASALALATRLAAIGVEPPDFTRLPFDESAENDVFPILVDAGWELLPLAGLDAERHRGAMNAFGDALAFDVAKFEEENTEPPEATLHELPALGAIELLAAFDEEGDARAPFVLWSSGHETYVDYVLRGILKVAKLTMA